MFLIFDTETTGFPKRKDAPISDLNNWPRVVQLSWQIHDKLGNLIKNHDYIIKPEGFTIPFNAQKVHGISTEFALKEGIDIQEALMIFEKSISESKFIIGHNIIGFDIPIIESEFYRNKISTTIKDKKFIDTITEGTHFCAIPGGRGGGFKYPKLSELYTHLFNEEFSDAHNAAADVNANSRAFLEMLRREIISKNQINFSEDQFSQFLQNNPNVVPPFSIKVKKSETSHNSIVENDLKETQKEESGTYYKNFFQFHNHTTYSILLGFSKPKDLINKAIEYNMPAVGITDFGNLMGAFQFIKEAKKINEIQKEKNPDFVPIIPIIGCEMYISETYTQHKFTKDNPDRRYTQVLLAKNYNGYKNLSKISTIGYTEGYYAGVPRVNKKIIAQYKENIIATTGGLHSEIPYLILNHGEKQAEDIFLWYLDVFQDDFYIELQNHLLEEEKHINEVLLKFAKKYNVAVLPQNESYYLEDSQAYLQDILVCIKENEKINTPIGTGFGKRFGFDSHEYTFKSSKAQSILSINNEKYFKNFEEFINKFETYDLAQNVLLPKFNIPEEYKDPQDEIDDGVRGENAYLRHLTYEGAKKRYPEITKEIETRIDFELETIKKTGYPGYFLIVQDFTTQARLMDVVVGPGRGSAAGSVVAYCTGITNVDPIKYDLLFERFLNPDRISLPDIDIDFDDRGRDKVIKWVVDKYGHNQVAQIITYGTLAGRSAIRDTSRVLDLPLHISDTMAKKLPSTLNLTKLKTIDEKTLLQKARPEEAENIKSLKKLFEGDSLDANVMQNASNIEGSIRNTGVHACGIIITPVDISNLVPVAVSKESDLWISQFDNSVVEEAGLLKMDFLGLRTLTIIKDAIEIIKIKKGIELNTDEFDLEDAKVYDAVFKDGNTIGIFQYESVGMQKHLRGLKPDKFDDLIAMNALFRPGPMQYIPNFIARKNGVEKIQYDLPEMEEILSDTYGITVYQEQVMLLSQKLANFTKGQADTLRKAMGKKQMDILQKMYPDFIKGGKENNHPEEILEKIWKDWQAFAQYAFNKSHSTCYALIAYQTAYLKTHFPAEYMAALLSNNLSNLKTLTLFMEECKKMNIEVLGPDINESINQFFVNDKGAIRFGLEAVKGIGKHAVDSIVEERNLNGPYTSIFNFFERVDLKNISKKTVENLAYSGAFDTFDEYHRSVYFSIDPNNNKMALENLLNYGATYQFHKNNSQNSLFGDEDTGFEILKPTLPDAPKWNILQKLNKEKEIIGIYISSHPLDEYKYELKLLNIVPLEQLQSNTESFKNREITVAGMISKVDFRMTKDGRSEFAIFELEDYNSTYSFRVFGEHFMKIKYLLEPHRFVYAKVQVKDNYTKTDVYVNITKMELLKNVMDKMANKLFLNIPLGILNKEMIDKIMNLLLKNKGEKLVYIRLLENEQSLKMKSSKYKINISKEILTEIENDLKLSFNLN